MNCNCISKIEIKLAKRYSEELGVDASADCQSAGFSMSDNSIRVIHKTEFKIVAQAKGFTRGKLIPVISSYCPFCGKSTAEGASHS
ncbi:gp41 [Burkholderia pseudomallei]|nr:gp41 [Burkholderia pseudomallei]